MNDLLTKEFATGHGDVRYGSAGDGPPVILQHGTPTSAAIWRRVIDSLKDAYTLYYLDLPGYGDSAKFAGQDVRLRAFAQTVSEFARHLKLERPHLVGHDFGAAAVLGAHLIEGLDVASITVIDGVVLSPWGTPFSRHVKQHEAIFAAVPGYVHEAVLEAHLKTAVAKPLDAVTMRSLLEPWTGEEGQMAYYRQVGQYDYEYTTILEKVYRNIAVPVTIVWGTEDRWVDIAEGRRLREMIPGSVFETIPGAGHFSMLDAPEAVSRTLRATLQRVSVSGK